PRAGRSTSRDRSAPASTTTRKATAATSPRSSRSACSSWAAAGAAPRRRAGRRRPRSRRSAPRPPRKTTTFRSERKWSLLPLVESDPASRRAGACHETADRIEHGLELDIVPLFERIELLREVLVTPHQENAPLDQLRRHDLGW